MHSNQEVILRGCARGRCIGTLKNIYRASATNGNWGVSKAGGAVNFEF